MLHKAFLLTCLLVGQSPRVGLSRPFRPLSYRSSAVRCSVHYSPCEFWIGFPAPQSSPKLVPWLCRRSIQQQKQGSVSGLGLRNIDDLARMSATWLESDNVLLLSVPKGVSCGGQSYAVDQFTLRIANSQCNDPSFEVT
jgi:hypothetical protein